MHSFFYIFNQFNEIAKQQNINKTNIQKSRKKTEKSVKKNSDKKNVAGNRDLIIFTIASLCEKLKS